MAENQFNVDKTIRIEVELEKTGDDSFPEFSYVALLDELNKVDTQTNGLNKSDQGKSVFLGSFILSFYRLQITEIHKNPNFFTDKLY